MKIRISSIVDDFTRLIVEEGVLVLYHETLPLRGRNVALTSERIVGINLAEQTGEISEQIIFVTS